jgi:hypothetical protein
MRSCEGPNPSPGVYRNRRIHIPPAKALRGLCGLRGTALSGRDLEIGDTIVTQASIGLPLPGNVSNCLSGQHSQSQPSRPCRLRILVSEESRPGVVSRAI